MVLHFPTSVCRHVFHVQDLLRDEDFTTQLPSAAAVVPWVYLGLTCVNAAFMLVRFVPNTCVSHMVFGELVVEIQ